MMMWRGLSPKLLASLFDRRWRACEEKAAAASIRSDFMRGGDTHQQLTSQTSIPPRNVATPQR